MSHTINLARATGLGLTAVSLSVLLLAACGGGGSASTPHKSAYAFGKISGFGSVVVNGVHYNENNAIVADEDGATHNQNELKLGTVVEVQAGEFGKANDVTTANAQNITLNSLMRGPIESIGIDSVVVLGQTVKVTTTTVFDESLKGGLSALKAGAVVRIYGRLEAATGAYTATRIEPLSGAEFYGLRGSVSAYDPVAKTLRIGTTLIDVSTATLPDGLKVGSLVRIKLQTTKVNGAWVAVSVKSGLYHPQDNDNSEVEGIITDFTSATSFSVDGLPVDASKAAFHSSTTDVTIVLAKGVRVEVEGSVVNGVLVATNVQTKTDQDERNQGFGIDGLITSLDTVKSTFVARGVTVSYAGSVKFVGGTAADLKLNGRVEVHGDLATDGSTLNATSIKIVP